MAAVGINPLVHYISEGRKQGRRPRAANYVSTAVIATAGFERAKGDAWRASFAARLEQRMAALGHADLSPPFRDMPPDVAVGDAAASIGQKLRARAAATTAAARAGVKTDVTGKPIPVKRPTFSVIMTVYDTDPVFLRELADSVRAQAFADYEWLILDNGSRVPDTIRLCQEIAASDPRFSLFRVEDNLHIIGGNRYVFERAKGHYVVPIDSDDLLYPDSLALFADVLRHERADPPVLLYSDEQKVDRAGAPVELIWRWTFSFAHGMSTAPAAHLMAFARGAAQEAGVYTDDYARGSHDWDSMLRITERGGGARHVPEVLYGWRAHGASTASATVAKDYIANSQSAVMANALARRHLDHSFDPKDLFQGSLAGITLTVGRHHFHRS